MIFDKVDTDVFQYYLDYLAQEIPPLDSKRRLLIVDNASWHKAQRLNWHHFEMPGGAFQTPDSHCKHNSLGDFAAFGAWSCRQVDVKEIAVWIVVQFHGVSLRSQK
jgi:hypothetical protein